MKKITAIIAALIMAAVCLSACGSENAPADETAAAESAQAAEENAAGDSLHIVTTIFPEYDWVMNILGEKAADAEVTMLLDSGVDLHSYQPTADDILKIASCDVFIYVGGESDEWVEDALKEATNKEMVVVNLLETLGDSAKEEEVVEGMQAEEEHDHDDDEEHDEGEEHEEEGPEYDEHVWLSLKNAAALVNSIAGSISAADETNADTYKANVEAYIEKINALDAKYAEAISAGSVKTLLFGDRFPFRYMTDDYGLDYYAAFVGCSAETEASFETVAFLAQKVDELGLHTVMTIEGTDHRIAETIVQSTQTKDQQILSLNSMQSTTSKDVSAGSTYLSIMENNLEVLKEALK